MKPCGSNQVSAQIFVAEPQDANQVAEPSLLAAGDICIPWVGAANMGSKRTSTSGHILPVGKLVEPDVLLSRGLVPSVSHSGNRAAAHRNQWRAISKGPSHHGFRQLVAFEAPGAGCFIHELPEGAYVLLEFAHYNIGAIQAKVFFVRMVGSFEQFLCPGICW